MSIFREIPLKSAVFNKPKSLIIKQIYPHLRAFSAKSRSTNSFSSTRKRSLSSKFPLIYEHFPRNTARQRRFHQPENARYQANLSSFTSIFREILLNSAVFIKPKTLVIEQFCPHLRAFSAKYRSATSFSSNRKRSSSSNFPLIYEHFPRNPAQQRHFHQTESARYQAILLSFTSIFREIPLNDFIFIKPKSLIIKQICPHLRAFSAKYRSATSFSSSRKRSLSSNFALIYEHFPRNTAQRLHFHQTENAHHQANLPSFTSIFREIPLSDFIFIKPKALIIKQFYPHLRAFSAKYRSTAPFSLSRKRSLSSNFTLIYEHFPRKISQRFPFHQSENTRRRLPDNPRDPCRRAR